MMLIHELVLVSLYDAVDITFLQSHKEDVVFCSTLSILIEIQFSRENCASVADHEKIKCKYIALLRALCTCQSDAAPHKVILLVPKFIRS